MTHVEVTVTQTFHFHGFSMDTAVSKAVNALGIPATHVKIKARYIDDDTEDANRAERR